MTFTAAVPRTVTVVAHRGSSAAVAEHTLAAYEQAIVEGADALECDVRLTRDGVLVCVHDRRVDRTSDGRGVVSTLELADLAELDFGSWRRGDRDMLLSADWEQPDLDRNGVLTFERLLQLTLEAPRPVQLHVETKHPTRYAGKVERTLVSVLERHGLHRPVSRSVSRVTVMSFSPVGLRRVHALAPMLPTVLLLDRVPRWLRDGSLPQQVQIAGPSVDIVRLHPSYVDKLHSRGHRAHVWTVDDPADIELCLSLGVDAVITNRPRAVLTALGR